jgi:Protein of unknown function (DUF4236)
MKQIFHGARLNLDKRSASTTFACRGARLTTAPKGLTAAVSLFAGLA